MINLSLRNLSNYSKDERSFVNTFTNYWQINFSQLIDMLTKDFMYSPFNFVGYIQSREGLTGLAGFIVLDVDNTLINLHDRLEQFIGEDINCIIGSTSDPTNIHKYRILIPTDQLLSPSQYKLLVDGIRQNGLVTDYDNVSNQASRKYYSYSGSTVVSHLTGSALSVTDYIAEEPPKREFGSVELSDQSFNWCSTITQGSRTRKLLYIAFRLQDQGYSYQSIESAVLTANQQFLAPKHVSDVYRRVLSKFT